MQIIKKVLTSTLKFIIAAYAGVLILLMFWENRQVYPRVTAAQEWLPPPSANIQDVDLTAADGTPLHAWWCPYRDPDTKQERTSDGAVLYLHGNYGNLSHRGKSIVAMAEKLKLGVLIIDYPGYGKSGGQPSEMGCYAAGDAAYDWLVSTKKIDPRRIILYGGSMGGGIAVDLASRKPHRALVVAKTFTSMPDVGQHKLPWLPVRWLMRNRFNNLHKIESCTRPVFVAHSPDDEVIPYSQAERLFAAAHEPKQFVRLQGGHNDPLGEDFFAPLLEFLRERAPV